MRSVIAAAPILLSLCGAAHAGGGQALPHGSEVRKTLREITSPRKNRSTPNLYVRLHEIEVVTRADIDAANEHASQLADRLTALQRGPRAFILSKKGWAHHKRIVAAKDEASHAKDVARYAQKMQYAQDFKAIAEEAFQLGLIEPDLHALASEGRLYPAHKGFFTPTRASMLVDEQVAKRDQIARDVVVAKIPHRQLERLLRIAGISLELTSPAALHAAIVAWNAHPSVEKIEASADELAAYTGINVRFHEALVEAEKKVAVATRFKDALGAASLMP